LKKGKYEKATKSRQTYWAQISDLEWIDFELVHGCRIDNKGRYAVTFIDDPACQKVSSLKEFGRGLV